MSITAERYAQALFELAQEQKNLEDIQGSLTSLKNLIERSEDFRLFLYNPLLSYEETCKILKAMFEGKVPELLSRFLVFITQKNRLGLLKEMIESFDGMYLSATQQMRAYVKTALPLKDEEKAFIAQKLHEKFHQKTMITWGLDPSLIGGFRIFAQGKLYDYSFKDQLDSFLQKTTQPV
jgi:F-type H+-transporting ATPase subunit delta